MTPDVKEKGASLTPVMEEKWASLTPVMEEKRAGLTPALEIQQEDGDWLSCAIGPDHRSRGAGG